MGLAFHCYGGHKLTKWRWKRKKIQRARRDSSHKPNSPPSAPNRVVRAPKCSRWVSLETIRRKRANLPHKRKCHLVEPYTTKWDLKMRRQELCLPLDTLQVMLGTGPLECVLPGGNECAARRWLPWIRLAHGPGSPDDGLVFLFIVFFIFFLLLKVTPLFGFWNKASCLQMDTKNGD